MSINNSIAHRIEAIKQSIPTGVTLVTVSKTKSASTILEAYQAGQRIFGENKVQEIVAKQEQLPKDIQWHFIGHLQSNKVKYIAPFIALIHGVDSVKLLQVINTQAKNNQRMIDCLIQIHVAQEETKYGFDVKEALELFQNTCFQEQFPQLRICGLMGMASNTSDERQVKTEFQTLKSCFDQIKSTHLSSQEVANFNILSMGMSGDYPLAIEAGSTLIRVGSAIF